MHWQARDNYGDHQAMAILESLTDLEALKVLPWMRVLQMLIGDGGLILQRPMNRCGVALISYSHLVPDIPVNVYCVWGMRASPQIRSRGCLQEVPVVVKPLYFAWCYT